MAVHFSNHVRRRSIGPICDVVVEVFLGDKWYEAYRIALTSDGDAFQQASDVGYALVPLVKTLEMLDIEFPVELRMMMAHCKCRVQNLFFEFYSKSNDVFFAKYETFIADPEEFNNAIHTLSSHFRKASH